MTTKINGQLEVPNSVRAKHRHTLNKGRAGCITVELQVPELLCTGLFRKLKEIGREEICNGMLHNNRFYR